MNNESTTRYGTAWSRDELILALYLYCQIPFARTKANNPEVIRLAKLINRTPSSVARKLGNFGAFDPLLANKGISGLTHVGRMDREIWNEFYGQWEMLVEQSQQLLHLYSAEEVPQTQEELPVIVIPKGKTEKSSVVMTRLCQSFFRKAVLSSYESSCCVCGIDIPQLLVASHIIPWSNNHETRTDPQNGLCLCSLHDKAFDRGIMAISESYIIKISSVAKYSRADFCKISIFAFEGKNIVLPKRFVPKQSYLEWHSNNIFKRP